MSNFLMRLAARSLGLMDVISPRRPSLFEPPLQNDSTNPDFNASEAAMPNDALSQASAREGNSYPQIRNSAFSFMSLKRESLKPEGSGYQTSHGSLKTSDGMEMSGSLSNSIVSRSHLHEMKSDKAPLSETVPAENHFKIIDNSRVAEEGVAQLDGIDGILSLRASPALPPEIEEDGNAAKDNAIAKSPERHSRSIITGKGLADPGSNPQREPDAQPYNFIYTKPYNLSFNLSRLAGSVESGHQATKQHLAIQKKKLHIGTASAAEPLNEDRQPWVRRTRAFFKKSYLKAARSHLRQEAFPFKPQSEYAESGERNSIKEIASSSPSSPLSSSSSKKSHSLDVSSSFAKSIPGPTDGKRAEYFGLFDLYRAFQRQRHNSAAFALNLPDREKFNAQTAKLPLEINDSAAFSEEKAGYNGLPKSANYKGRLYLQRDIVDRQYPPITGSSGLAGSAGPSSFIDVSKIEPVKKKDDHLVLFNGEKTSVGVKQISKSRSSLQPFYKSNRYQSSQSQNSFSGKTPNHESFSFTPPSHLSRSQIPSSEVPSNQVIPSLFSLSEAAKSQVSQPRSTPFKSSPSQIPSSDMPPNQISPSTESSSSAALSPITQLKSHPSRSSPFQIPSSEIPQNQVTQSLESPSLAAESPISQSRSLSSKSHPSRSSLFQIPSSEIPQNQVTQSLESPSLAAESPISQSQSPSSKSHPSRSSLFQIPSSEIPPNQITQSLESPSLAAESPISQSQSPSSKSHPSRSSPFQIPSSEIPRNQVTQSLESPSLAAESPISQSQSPSSKSHPSRSSPFQIPSSEIPRNQVTQSLESLSLAAESPLSQSQSHPSRSSPFQIPSSEIPRNQVLQLLQSPSLVAESPIFQSEYPSSRPSKSQISSPKISRKQVLPSPISSSQNFPPKAANLLPEFIPAVPLPQDVPLPVPGSQVISSQAASFEASRSQISPLPLGSSNIFRPEEDSYLPKINR